MYRDTAEAIAYTIFRAVTHGADIDSDYIQCIADDVELYGHLDTLKTWARAQS